LDLAIAVQHSTSLARHVPVRLHTSAEFGACEASSLGTLWRSEKESSLCTEKILCAHLMILHISIDGEIAV